VATAAGGHGAEGRRGLVAVGVRVAVERR
jgi:hypothetical protein